MSSMSEMIGEYFYLIWWEDIESWIKKEWWKYDLRIQISGFRSGYFSSLRWNLIKHVRYSPPLNESGSSLNRSYLRPSIGYLQYMNRISSYRSIKRPVFLRSGKSIQAIKLGPTIFSLSTEQQPYEIFLSYIMIDLRINSLRKNFSSG